MKKKLQLFNSGYLRMVFVVLFLCCTKSHAAIRHVKPGSAGTAPYDTWNIASNDLQAVINFCNPGDEIWIAAGTYKPNRRADALTVITSANRNNAFVLKTGVKIYGGFTGLETSLSQRNVTANVVTLSGDIGTVGLDTDNCYHVVISAGNNNATRLDGVQVVLGNANGSAFATITVNTRTIVPTKGGGVYTAASTAVFDECTIRRNLCSVNGAGIYDTLAAAPNFTNCVITQNISGYNGAGIYNAGSSPVISNCDINQNDAGNHGGGIYNDGSSPDFTSCDVSQNEAATNGAGMYNTGSAINFTGGFIMDNIAGNLGGGIYNGTSSDGDFINIKILNNSAVRGGGLFNNNSSPFISNCALHNNSASLSGGAVFAVNSNNIEIDQCTFNFNTAATEGGALYVDGATSPEIKNCSFRSNSAINAGGGIYIISADVVFINCLVAGNVANLCGGISFGLSDVSFINCTVASNKGVNNFGGIGVSGGANLILRNSIIWGNESPLVDNIGGGGIINATYSNIQGGAAGAGNINSNPMFTSPQPAANAPTTSGEYSVLKCSPVINAGSNSLVPGGITQDIDGNVRINYGIVDMGAHEKKLAVKAPSGIVYVDHTKSGNGSNWTNATPSLADALLTAKYDGTITQIWVAKGTYYPEYNATNLASLVCNPANRYNSFVLVPDVNIYGGFINGAATLAERDPIGNVTTLNGDINLDNTSAGNTYHVVISAGTVGSAVLDGFTITGGNADYSGNSVTVNGITVTSFYGGGMGISLSSPAINDCILEGNYGDHGGAISVLSGAPVFSRCIIRNNTAGLYGGALDHWVIGPPSNAVFNNCLITGNRSNNVGGAFVNTYPSVIRLNNTTVSGNFAVNQGGGLWSNGQASEIFRNSILWGNKVGTSASNIHVVGPGTVNAAYCAIEGGYAGTGNINADPLFINPQSASAAPTVMGNYRLQKCSPAINTGSNAAIPAGITKDLDSSMRIHLGVVDIGAYEKHLAKPDRNGIVYVDSANTSVVGDGRSWAEAVTELADVLKEARDNNEIKEIWVAKGTYKPLFHAADGFKNTICNASSRDAAFVLPKDVKIYGGFLNGETDVNARNFNVNKSILSGDIGTVAFPNDNVYHILIASGDVGTTSLDGFEINGGYSSGVGTVVVNGLTIGANNGAGLYTFNASLSIFNCIYSSNFALNGAAIFNYVNSPASQLNLKIANSYFYNNQAIYGGAIFNEINSSLTISNSRFKANTGTFGGAIRNANLLFLIQCEFTGNIASQTGGAVSNMDSTTISGCTFSGNKATNEGGAVANHNISGKLLRIRNSILYSNSATISPNVHVGPAETTINYSIIEGGYAGTGNYDLDPLFISPQLPASAPTTSGDYRLQACSPAINSGNNDSIPPGITKDLDSLDRIKFTTVDMGAYEKQDVDLANTTWKGINTNWNDKINWCGGFIPADTTNVTVPVTINNPLINAGYENEVKNISFANNTSIGIANTGKLTINGTYTNSGSTITNNGTWVMTGTATGQTFPGLSATVMAMNNLEINNPNGIKFNKSFELTGILIPDDGNINVDNATVTLNSDASGTARIEAVPPTVAFSYTGTGKFEIERYIPPHRAWRLLTAPLSTATNLTISQAWQEGVSNANRLSPVDPSPGFGTIITKSTSYSAADGYDQGSTNNPSIRYYNGTNWGGFPSATNGITPGANNGLINDQQGYMLFVRGDRGIQVAGTGVTATVTTLRPKGQLKTGPQTINCSGWTVIGNPYASPINFHKIVLDNPGLPDVFYVWDANLAGSSNVGGWVSYGSFDGASQTYTVAPFLPGSTFANNRGDISSGSAFMVNYTGTIIINENHKSIMGDNVLYRPTRQLSMNLFVAGADSTESLNDGLIITFNESSRDANAEKNKNFTENLAAVFNNKFYAIQNRQRPHFNDTIFISAGQMRQRRYVLEIRAAELNMPNRMKAFLEDTYLHQYKPVALEGSTRYAFTVNTDSASISSARFRLLFKKAPRFKSVHAIAKGKDIEVDWQMEEDFSIGQYEIERSVNGIDFTSVTTQQANKYHQAVLQNTWMDISPAAGVYYYRIKATGIDGEILYSDIVIATMANNKAGWYVYPNPVTGNQIQLRMNLQLPGKYKATLLSNAGQKICTQQWQYNGGYATTTFQLPDLIAAGSYQLEIINTNGKKEVVLVEVQR